MTRMTPERCEAKPLIDREDARTSAYDQRMLAAIALGRKMDEHIRLVHYENGRNISATARQFGLSHDEILYIVTWPSDRKPAGWPPSGI